MAERSREIDAIIPCTYLYHNSDTPVLLTYTPLLHSVNDDDDDGDDDDEAGSNRSKVSHSAAYMIKRALGESKPSPRQL